LSSAVVLFTGGKDSVYALHRAVKEGLEVRALATVTPHYKYSMLYHQPNYLSLLAQAQALSTPLETIGLYNPEYEVEALKHLLGRVKKKYGVGTIVTGSVKSRFQLRVFNEVANRLGLKIYAPCWGISELEYMKELLGSGIEFMVISITSMGIPHYLLGKVFDINDLEKLMKLAEKYGFNISFEGGEAETLAVNAPLFKYRLVIYGKRVVVSEFEGYFQVEKVVLAKK